MKRNHSIWAHSGVIWLVASVCFASSPSWDGTWKVTKSSSTVPKPNFIITILSTGEYHFDDGVYTYNFRCDGKEYRVTASRTTSCTQKSASTMDKMRSEEGKQVDSQHWELSGDGKMLTVTTTSPKPDGSVKTVEKVYSPISRSSGFAGGWKDTKELESMPQLVSKLTERSFHMAFADGRQYMDPALDGSDAPVYGPNVPQGLTIAINAHGPLEFLTVQKLGGRVINQGVLKLSVDGRTLTDEYWTPDRPDLKATIVYEKQ
jgi:hypothetical protein